MNLFYKSLLIASFFVGHSMLAKQLNLAEAGILMPKQDSVWQKETAVVNGVRYIAANFLSKKDGEYRFCLKDASGKVIYTIDEALPGFRFSDFNKDGYKDLILELRGVESGGQNLLLYDPSKKNFVLAGNCSNAEKIPNTAYYYTYEDCCMGRNWSSELFYISDFKIVDIGYAKYEDGYGLSFFKIHDKKKILIEKRNVRINGNTPIRTGPHIDFDPGKYWKKHWRTYVK